VSPFVWPDIFYPGGWDLRFAAFPPLYPALLAPFTVSLGPVTTYNLSLLFSCVFAAYGAFLLAEHVSRSWRGACLAGVLFAYFRQREVYLGGHLNFLLGSMWLPWLVYGVVRLLRSTRRRVQWAMFAGLALGLSIAGAWQFVFISGGLLALLLIGMLITHPKRVWNLVLDHRVVSGFLTTCILVAAPQAAMMLPARKLAVDAPWSFGSADVTSVHLERVLSPSWINPIWQRISREWWPLENWQDGVVGVSLAALGVVIFALFRGRLKGATSWWLLLLGGTALMLGLTLHVGGQTLLIPVPDSFASLAAAVWQRLSGEVYPGHWAGHVPVLLPNGLVFLLLPPYRNFHHYGRWALVSSLGLAVLAAKSLGSVSGNLVSWKRAGLGTMFLLAVLFEFNMQPAVNVTSTADMAREVDAWLAAQPERSVIIEYPLSYSNSGQTLFYASFHRQIMVHGYSSVPPKAFDEIRPVLDRWPSEETLDLLSTLGADYVLVNVFAHNQEIFRDQALPEVLSHERVQLVERFSDAVGPVREIYLFKLLW